MHTILNTLVIFSNIKIIKRWKRTNVAQSLKLYSWYIPMEVIKFYFTLQKAFSFLLNQTIIPLNNFATLYIKVFIVAWNLGYSNNLMQIVGNSTAHALRAQICWVHSSLQTRRKTCYIQCITHQQIFNGCVILCNLYWI